MVGVQCKSCGHRALASPDPPKLDHEIITLLSQSSITCSACGGSKYAVLRFPSGAAETWLKGDVSPAPAGPLIEGGNQG